MFNVGCKVSGGVTGTRQSLLKEDGKVIDFATREEAQKRADDLNLSMNNKYSRATFNYWVEEN